LPAGDSESGPVSDDRSDARASEAVLVATGSPGAGAVGAGWLRFQGRLQIRVGTFSLGAGLTASGKGS
jgi:hypothetical protein